MAQKQNFNSIAFFLKTTFYRIPFSFNFRMIRILLLLLLFLSCSCFHEKTALRRGMLNTPNSREILTGVDTLPQNIRIKANEMLIKIMDNEGLYTLIGELKPISDIYFESPYSNDKDHLLIINNIRRALRGISNDNLSFGLQIRNYKGQYFFDLWILRKELVEKKILEYRSSFFSNGVRYDISLHDLLIKLEAGDFPNKRMVYGLLFGYPKYAVDFFCNPERFNEIDNVGSGIGFDSKLFKIDTYDPNGGFIYAIPKNQIPTKEDSVIYKKGKMILSDYKYRRSLYSSAGGVVDAIKLIKNWYKDIYNENIRNCKGNKTKRTKLMNEEIL
ncbi:MAG: hypothetical protein NTY07_21120 [Bacteroidia bacterium]|nr:hypothetical protein [Bacteroidia bacterium]